MTRTRVLRPGINSLSRGRATNVRGRFHHIKKGADGAAKSLKKHPLKKKPEEKKHVGEPKWYTADDISRPLFSRKSRSKPTRLRKTIQPGTVLIILAGRFRGKRVIFLKQLQPSGLLLVTGPYKVNGVPLRRINQAYVIATSTRIELPKDVTTATATVDDKFFKRVEQEEKKGDEKDEFFASKEKKNVVSSVRKQAQAAVDKALLAGPVNDKTALAMYKYLSAKFSLTHGQHPHLMAF